MKALIIALAALFTFPAKATSTKDVEFMVGCWGTTKDNGSKVTEDWFRGSKNLMPGVSQTVNSYGSTVANEFLKIEWDDMKRALTYTPIIDGHAFPAFVHKKSALAKKAEFVNSKPNDFPAIIAYEAVGDMALKVSLIGPGEKGETQTISYELNREDCNSRF